MAGINTAGRHPAPQKTADWYTKSFTMPNGCPIDNPLHSNKIQQKNGNTYKISQILQDNYVMDQIAHLDRERIPERFGHANGCGAYGEFTVTSDEIQKYTCADFLSEKGKKTPLFARLSTTSAFRGSADTVRDTRGFAFKFYTDEGNLDWAFFWPGVFSIWDNGKIITNNHVTKKCPWSGLSDPNMHFDFITKNQEALNSSIRLHSDDGTPRRYNDITIRSLNTYMFVKDCQTYSYVRITLEPAHEIHTPFTNAEAASQAGLDPDYHTRRLYKQISNNNDKVDEYKGRQAELNAKLQGGKLSKAEQDKAKEEIKKLDDAIKGIHWPEWIVKAHIIQPEDVPKVKVNILDASKVFPKDQDDIIKTIEVGRLQLNRLPLNQFAEVEQAAFCAANVVPGWDIAPDPILQARIFAYPDTQRHRLGVNAEHLPVNRPKHAWNPLRRDGPAALFNYDDVPTYVADYNGAKAKEGTNTADMITNPEPWLDAKDQHPTPVVPLWDKNGSFDVTRGLNEWAEQDPLEQPWDYYINDLAGPPPKKHANQKYAHMARTKGIHYRQWALVENYAQHLSAVREELREATYAMFRTMDDQYRTDKSRKYHNLGDLIQERTNEVISEKNKVKDSDSEGDDVPVGPRKATLPLLGISPASVRPNESELPN
ncbi:hypothetical protein ASPWEDRAFT_66442 [Aspergillus wentii DTO 134E9]|uniref:Catalase core domain-containing protein n=1 Tax=Aspergillus wentii DTO 134E9 TaxID=1073089 RepID=A0A1L9RXL6_ASPWE|nr:uncharacterized protein ASPWEDRAFT_66442 [Aspergillus wentii DTO 134E9]OJJ39643.1 hypothetical protein ASPWEDRAFT_66442 [Aspergillus wentii DTO 134E9]